MCSVWRVMCGLVVSSVGVLPALATEEAQEVIARLLAPPTVQTEPGFTAKILVPPGELYDPLQILSHEGKVYVGDDGGEEGETGGRLLTVDQAGKVTVIIDDNKVLPIIGFGFAPASFGDFGGQIFGLAQAKVGLPGQTINHVVQRIDRERDYASTVVCTLLEVNGNPSAGGVVSYFGPAGSLFVDRFFSSTAISNTVYQTTADGQCKPFVTFDQEKWGWPFGLWFTPDGQAMVVGVARGKDVTTPTPGSGTIVRVAPDGTVDDKPLATGFTMPIGIDFAPKGFGQYGGQLFVSDIAKFQAPVPLTQTVDEDGKIYRVTPEGKLKLVASGLRNPAGIRFVGDALWVTDLNGDFMGGRRELPDGFIVEIRAQ